MIPAASGRPLVTSHLHKTLYSGRGVGWILNKCWQCTAQQTPDMLVLHMSIMFEELTLRINTVSSGLVRTQNILGKDHFFCRHKQHVLERFSKNESESEL